jgi:hypothetical protein
MGMPLDELANLPGRRCRSPHVVEHQEFLERVGAPAGPRSHVDAAALDIAMARLRDRNVTTAPSFVGFKNLGGILEYPLSHMSGPRPPLTSSPPSAE